jgi:hypothetical protein
MIAARSNVIRTQAAFLIVGLLFFQPAARAQAPGEVRSLEPRLVHLRSGPVREWSSFPEQPEASYLETRFAAQKNSGEMALRLRQQDVKQAWRVLLNGKSLGELVRDENDQTLFLPIAAGALVDGENTLRIESPARSAAQSDDIRVGEISIDPRPVADVLGEATLNVDVVDSDSSARLPARITIVNSSGALQALGIKSSDTLAVRSGVVYTATGQAQIRLPTGKYTVYAGRGFEYSLAQADVTLAPGQTAERTLKIRREVLTPGYVACDTHIHTLTHSGHGDASITERMITLAGEGIELPIATDHNTHIDFQPHAERLNVRRHFTPVVGNEVTTSVGHFNVFPTSSAAKVPDHKQTTWPAIFDQIFGTPGVKVAILNHARDLHGGTRPFGPKLFNAAIGERIDGWPMRFNAMEIINSGATQTDPLRLVHDWMALLNRGYRVTPVGSSDSHDVSRYIVGQGRTYIRCEDRDPANIDVASAVDNFLAGRVLVSYGLLVDPVVNGKYRAGDLVQPVGENIELDLRVLAPNWSKATRVQLFANGEPRITIDIQSGVQRLGKLNFPVPRHDIHLVAVATGPGVSGLYWPTAKPYQPTSHGWEPYVLGVSGAIFIDGDGDGRWTSPRECAERLFAEHRGDLPKFCEALAKTDNAVAAQAAHVLRMAGISLDSDEISPAIRNGDGFRTYREAWRENERARAEP